MSVMKPLSLFSLYFYSLYSHIFRPCAYFLLLHEIYCSVFNFLLIRPYSHAFTSSFIGNVIKARETERARARESLTEIKFIRRTRYLRRWRRRARLPDYFRQHGITANMHSRTHIPFPPPCQRSRRATHRR